jgi:Ni/Co efflux regulator RcnB
VTNLEIVPLCLAHAKVAMRIFLCACVSVFLSLARVVFARAQDANAETRDRRKLAGRQLADYRGTRTHTHTHTHTHAHAHVANTDMRHRHGQGQADALRQTQEEWREREKEREQYFLSPSI